MEKSLKKPTVTKLALSVTEFAEAYGLSRTKAYQLVNRAGFPASRIDGRIIIPVDELREWMKNQRLALHRRGMGVSA